MFPFILPASSTIDVTKNAQVVITLMNIYFIKIKLMLQL